MRILVNVPEIFIHFHLNCNGSVNEPSTAIRGVNPLDGNILNFKSNPCAVLYYFKSSFEYIRSVI